MPNIKLKTNDGRVFVVDVDVAKCSEMINTMLEDLGGVEERGTGDAELVGTLDKLDGPTFEKVLEWATYYKQGGGGSERTVEEVKEWDANFMSGWDQKTLNEVILAANFLDIKALLDTTFGKVKSMIQGKTPEELRAIFKFDNEVEENVLMGLVDDSNVKLQSSDGARLYLDIEIAKLLPKVKSLMEEKQTMEKVIRLPFDFSATLLEKVVDWVKFHRNDPVAVTEAESSKKFEISLISDWDKKFLKPLDAGDLFEMVLLAHKLEINNLQTLLSGKITSMIIGKEPDEIRSTFLLKNDFSTEEAELVQKENSWVAKN
ncbi:S-phase kinase-associated protein 1 [Orchesella cincta]|uniref:S-phase kinase-associated protein 1 n=1 Tax=Orchesella cincta TaxID=48709 RepID=A0A1D2M8Y3_ORCCI|nr:S-phase kinase-associated protein 1 [Orchesella cincta]